jgi:hypothetical protein
MRQQFRGYNLLDGANMSGEAPNIQRSHIADDLVELKARIEAVEKHLKIFGSDSLDIRVS